MSNQTFDLQAFRRKRNLLSFFSLSGGSTVSLCCRLDFDDFSSVYILRMESQDEKVNTSVERNNSYRVATESFYEIARNLEFLTANKKIKKTNLSTLSESETTAPVDKTMHHIQSKPFGSGMVEKQNDPTTSEYNKTKFLNEITTKSQTLRPTVRGHLARAVRLSKGLSYPQTDSYESMITETTIKSAANPFKLKGLVLDMTNEHDKPITTNESSSQQFKSSIVSPKSPNNDTQDDIDKDPFIFKRSRLSRENYFEAYKDIFGVFLSASLTYFSFKSYMTLNYLFDSDTRITFTFNLSCFFFGIFFLAFFVFYNKNKNQLQRPNRLIFLIQNRNKSKFFSLIVLSCLINTCLLILYGFFCLSHTFPGLLLGISVLIECFVFALNACLISLFFVVILNFIDDTCHKFGSMSKLGSHHVLSILLAICLQLNYFYTAGVLYFANGYRNLRELMDRLCLTTTIFTAKCFSFLQSERMYAYDIEHFKYINKMSNETFENFAARDQDRNSIQTNRSFVDVYSVLFGMTLICLVISVVIPFLLKYVGNKRGLQPIGFENNLIKNQVKCLFSFFFYYYQSQLLFLLKDCQNSQEISRGKKSKFCDQHDFANGVLPWFPENSDNP